MVPRRSSAGNFGRSWFQARPGIARDRYDSDNTHHSRTGLLCTPEPTVPHGPLPVETLRGVSGQPTDSRVYSVYFLSRIQRDLPPFADTIGRRGYDHLLCLSWLSPDMAELIGIVSVKQDRSYSPLSFIHLPEFRTGCSFSITVRVHN